jgi:hypothetical protein
MENKISISLSYKQINGTLSNSMMMVGHGAWVVSVFMQVGRKRKGEKKNIKKIFFFPASVLAGEEEAAQY